MNQNRLLVIDDEPGIGEFIKDVAEGVGFEARITTSADEFRRAYRSFSPTAIILDLVMPEADGVELLRYLAEDRCQAQIMVASGVDPRVLATAKRIGDAYGLQMSGILEKPIMIPGLQSLLRRTSQARNSVNEQGLNAAIAERQLVVHFQPKLSFGNGAGPTIDSVEALVRWQHPQWGLVMPDKFIPLAEQTGLILPLTDLVARLVVEQLSEWDERGLHLSAAVNLAPQLLNRLELPDHLGQLADEHDIDRSRLVMEITESAAMADTGRTMDILARFRIKGMGVSIDDFGTGYSSLVALCRMPFNELKIDKSLVIELHKSEEAKLIVRSIVELAHNLGLSVCAEGTETADSVDFVRGCGCKSTQGYYVSKPLPADELEKFIHARH